MPIIIIEKLYFLKSQKGEITQIKCWMELSSLVNHPCRMDTFFHFFINSCQIVLMKYFFLITDLVYRGPMEDLEKEHRKLSQTLEIFV
jgi:hypothetical protein